MTKLKICLGLLAVLFITGCSHQIHIAPDLAQIRGDNTVKSSKTVGYYISPVKKTTEVTTSGGGGDDVKYFPYKDTEAALKTILSQKFSKVYALNEKTNDPLIASKNITFIFEPKIITDSHSSSAFTWPPTDFKVELTCMAYDKNGKNIWQKTVVGKGHAEFSEFVNDFSLSAKRASQQAFTMMRDEVLAATILK